MALTETTQKVLSYKKDPETGESLENEAPIVSEEYERTATGDDAVALLGEMKDWGQASLQQAWNRENRYGTETLSDPNGRPIKLLGTEVDRYREKGYGQKGLRPTFTVNGFGGMKRSGLRHFKVRYSNGMREVLLEE